MKPSEGRPALLELPASMPSAISASLLPMSQDGLRRGRRLKSLSPHRQSLQLCNFPLSGSLCSSAGCRLCSRICSACPCTPRNVTLLSASPGALHADDAPPLLHVRQHSILQQPLRAGQHCHRAALPPEGRGRPASRPCCHRAPPDADAT